MHHTKLKKLTEYWTEEMPVHEIANKLSVTTGAVYYHAYQMGLPKRDQRGEIAQFNYVDGFSDTEIIKQDEKFQHAVRRAIKFGSEIVTEGILVSPPIEWGVVRVTPAASHVSSQSIAAACLES